MRRKMSLTGQLGVSKKQQHLVHLGDKDKGLAPPKLRYILSIVSE